MPTSRLLTAAAAIPLLLAAVVPAVQAAADDVDTDPAPVQLLELTTGSGQLTEAAQAGLDDSPTPSVSGPSDGNGLTMSATGLRAIVTTAVDPETDAVLLTDPLEVDSFLVAGFTWDGSGDLPAGTQIFLRVREGGVWSSWYLNQSADAGPDDATGTSSTDEFITGGADAVQAAVVGDASDLPSNLQLAMVPGEPQGEEVLSPDDLESTEADSTPVETNSAQAAAAPTWPGTTSEPTAAPPDEATAETATPSDQGSAPVPAIQSPEPQTGNPGGGMAVNPAPGTILSAVTRANGLPVDVITRSEWGADPAYLDWSRNYVAADHVIVHHTAGTNNYTASQSASIVRGTYYYHAVTLGWGDIGYNFLVDKYGQVFEGRDGSTTAPAGKMVVGGHAYGANTGSMGISVMGTFTTVSPTIAQLDRVARMAGWFLVRSGVTNASASTSFTIRSTEKYQAGQVISLPVISGHRDVGYTTCPGDIGYSTLGAIRSTAQTVIAASTAPPVIGVILQAWNASGGAGGPWGQARAAQTTTAYGGIYQMFEGGTAYWTYWGGVQFVRNSMLSAYGRAGYERGSMGYPASDETTTAYGGTYQVFQGGTGYWTYWGGSYIVTTRMLSAYGRVGYEWGALGYPVSDETATAYGGTYQMFQGGTGYWSSRTGSHIVSGRMFTTYATLRYERGAFGYPTSDETGSVNGGTYQMFQNGTMYVARTGPAYMVGGAIFSRYGALGYERGVLGYPTSAEYAVSSGVSQNFEHGTITWNSRTGALSVSRS